MAQTDMNSSDSEDLRLLRESARTLFDRAGGSARARKLRDAGGGWDADMVRELAEAGVFGVTVPEDKGGLGMGLAAGGVLPCRLLAKEGLSRNSSGPGRCVCHVQRIA